MAVRIRRAEPGDGAAMGELSRSAFDAPLRDHLISTQPGIGRFWDVVLDNGPGFPGREFLVVEDGADLLGLAEFRVSGATSFLSHVCVADGARRRGIGTLLIRDHLERHPVISEMELDVFDDNHGAMRLYESLGFAARSSTAWLRSTVSVDGVAPSNLTFDDPHTSTAWFATFGFCEMRGRLGGTPFRAGRVGGGLLRLFETQDLTNAPLITELSRAFPLARHVLAVAPADAIPEGSVLEPFMHATRMRAADIRSTVLA